MHGQWDDMLFEGNTIMQEASSGGCYGFSLTAAYDYAEHFRNFVVRGNTIVNLGGCAICASAAPGIVIENNVVFNDQPAYSASILIPAIARGPGDEADSGAIIRNNTIYRPNGGASGPAISTGAEAGTNIVVVSNLVYHDGADAASCFAHSSASSFAAFANNLCHGAPWSSTHATLAAAQAAGFDDSGLDTEPRIAGVPAAANAWNVALAADSPAIDAGHASLSSMRDRMCMTRETPDIGAYER